MSSERRNDIIKAAGLCFSKYGYDKTTLDDISKIVGINKASFYYYFKNKEEIFAEMITAEADLFIERTKKTADKARFCKQRILKWITESFSYLETNSVLNQLSKESLQNLNPYLNELLDYSKKKGINYLEETLSHYLSKGEIKKIDISKTAYLIQEIIYALKNSMSQSLSNNELETEMHDRVIENIKLAVSLILDGIIIKKSNFK